jgi:pyrimidine-nucleoside phosphorylase
VRAVEIIARKRDGAELTSDEIQFFVHGCVSGAVADYQAAAWLMAVYLQGMNRAETVALTRAMASSGRVLDLGDLSTRAVDKHSSGGVGDKISLVVGPIAAAAGVVVPKMSGRGLGFTGGTLDKLESIPGFRVNLSVDEILKQAREVGLVIASQTADLAPADGKLYALRDVTATVGSLPLIVSSILSKKLAGGAPAIVLDVKVGSGAFMRTEQEAEQLALALVDVGTECGRRVTAFVSRVDQPLGRAVGNAVEVREAIETLRGEGPDDVRDLALTLATEMILSARVATTEGDAREIAERALGSGQALAKLRAMVEAQEGDARVIDDPSRLPTAPIVETIGAQVAGYVAALDAGTVGKTLTALGAGREKKRDPIDHRVGVIFHRKIGDRVMPGDPLFTLHLTTVEAMPLARERLLAAYRWSDAPVNCPSIVVGRYSSE